MKTIAIVYFSGYGHTKRLAEAVSQGATAAGGQTHVLPIDAEGVLPEGGWDTLAAADAIIFGSPTYMGSVAWQFKKFADASSKIWFTSGWRDKIFAGFTNSASMNGDKQITLQYMMTLALQHGGLWVGPALMPSNTKAAGRDDVNYLGSYGGLMSQSPADASAEEAPPKGDLETAKQFAARVVDVTQRFSR